MFRVFLGLGSNVGDRFAYLTKALDEIRTIATIVRTSSVYETEPWRIKNARPFYNMAIKIETELRPQELLSKLKNVEKKLGRTPDTHMKSREIDIDILLYDGFTFQDNNVTVPHSELHVRRFALEPLCEIAPSAIHPVLGKSVEKLLEECSDNSKVMRIEKLSAELHTITERM